MSSGCFQKYDSLKSKLTVPISSARPARPVPLAPNIVPIVAEGGSGPVHQHPAPASAVVVLPTTKFAA